MGWTANVMRNNLSPSILGASRNFVDIFSQRKDFQGGALGNPTLNQLGLHPLRMLATDGCLGIRRRLLQLKGTHASAASDLDGFFRDGVSVIHPFLPGEQFAAVHAEIKALTREKAAQHRLPENKHKPGFGDKQHFPGGFDRFDGSTLNRFFTIDDQQLPATSLAIRDPRLASLCELASGFAHRPERFFVYQTVQGNPENHDPQQDPHRDTFHSTVKLWLFLEDVPEELGPFAYAAGSHRMTWRRHLWEYRRANDVASSTSNRKGGAFRVSQEDLSRLNTQIRSYPVKANTLVIADVRGFHCRSIGRVGATRLSLYANLRRWPFSPLPWIPSP